MACVVFFCKQKTACELRISDWSSDVCSSDLLTARMRYRGLVKKRLVPVEIAGAVPEAGTVITRDGKEAGVLRSAVAGNGADAQTSLGLALQTGRASCRDRVCQSV